MTRDSQGRQAGREGSRSPSGGSRGTRGTVRSNSQCDAMNKFIEARTQFQIMMRLIQASSRAAWPALPARHRQPGLAGLFFGQPAVRRSPGPSGLSSQGAQQDTQCCCYCYCCAKPSPRLPRPWLSRYLRVWYLEAALQVVVVVVLVAIQARRR